MSRGLGDVYKRQLLPVGVKGIAFAALTAAIVSSLASMMNSISTIFTMDIYQVYIRPEGDASHLVRVGKMTSLVAMLIGVCIAPLLSGLDQAFQYIQEFTGFVSPGALSIFLAGFFYKRATSNGALVSAVASFVLSFVFKYLFPSLPWLDRMGIIFLLCCAILVLMGKKNPKGDDADRLLSRSLFHTDRIFLSLIHI